MSKTVTIVINGSQKVVQKEEMSYEEIVALDFPNAPPSETLQYTVQYSKGHHEHHNGSMIEGQSVKVKEGMEFDVTPTNRS